MNTLLKSDIFSHFGDMNYLPRWAVLLLDTFLCVIAYILSIVIGSSLFQYGWDHVTLELWQQILILIIIQIACFWCFHTYSGIIRYSTFVDVIKENR